MKYYDINKTRENCITRQVQVCVRDIKNDLSEERPENSSDGIVAILLPARPRKLRGGARESQASHSWRHCSSRVCACVRVQVCECVCACRISMLHPCDCASMLADTCVLIDCYACAITFDELKNSRNHTHTLTNEFEVPTRTMVFYNIHKAGHL